MVYKATIPKPTDQLKVSQADLLANFADIKTAFDVNHEALTGTGGDEGKHKQTTFPNNVAPTITSVAETALYSALGLSSGIPELYFMRANTGAGSLTSAMTEFSGHTPGGNDGFANLGGGNIIVRWNETIPGAVADFYDIVFVGGPGPVYFTTPVIFAVPNFVEANNTSTSISISNVGAAGFRVYVRLVQAVNVAPVAKSIYWIAIGRIV